MLLPNIGYGRAPMDVVFVLDCSGSMRLETDGRASASRMELAVRALELFAIGLTPDDTLGVSGFSWDLSALQIEPQPVTDGFFDQVKQRIYQERPDGFTDILLGIRAGRDMLKGLPDDPGRRKVLILLTDGRMQSRSAAAMVNRYGPGTDAFFGEQWRPLIARDTEWFNQSEISIHTIVLGSEEDARKKDIDLAFSSLVSSMTHGAMYWARSAEDLRPIYQNLWHQLTARPIPPQRVVGESIEVEVGDKITEMQIVLSTSRRPNLVSRIRGSQMDVNFLHNNRPITSSSHPSVSIRSRRGENALAYTIQDPEPGVWRIEPKGLQADIWVDVETWWTVEARVLGGIREELDVREPFLFEVAVLDKETGRPIEAPQQIQNMEVVGKVVPVHAQVELHDEGRVTLRWDADRKAFFGSYFSEDGRSSNVQGDFNVSANVRFFETLDTPAHTIMVRDIPPTGRLTTLPERIHAFASQGRRADLASVSDEGALVRPTLYLDAPRDISADVAVDLADLVHTDSGHRIPASRIQGERVFQLAARGTAEISLFLEVPDDTPAGRYQGTFMVRSRTPRVSGAELPVILDVGGPPPNVSLHAMAEPGASLELSVLLDVPEGLLPHVEIGMEQMVGPENTRFDIADARVSERQLKVRIQIPDDAPGGMYSANLPIHAPGLAEGVANVSVDVVHHRLLSEQIEMTLVPGKQAEAEFVIENTANELLEYQVKVSEDPLPKGVQLTVEPARASAFYELPARFRLLATAGEGVEGDVGTFIQVVSQLGPVAEVPIKLNVVRLDVERISRHDTFRVPAGETSAPIEYRLTTSSQQPLSLDVIAEEWLSDDGRALTIDAVEFESDGVRREGRTEITISAEQPATLLVRAKAPAHARGDYEGYFVITSPGYSEVREPLKLQAGAIWIEGENPLVFSEDTEHWQGSILVRSSLEAPVSIVFEAKGAHELVNALTVRSGMETTSPEKPMRIELSVDRESLSYGRHTARILLDSQGAAGTAIWTIQLTKRPIEVISRISVRTPDDRRFTRDPIVFQDRSVGYVSEWLWDFGDGNTSTEQHPLHTYTTPGTYDVVLQVSGSHGQSTDRVQVSVEEGFVVEFDVKPRRGQLPLGGRPLRVKTRNLSKGGDLVFSWDFGDESPKSSEFEPEQAYSSTGDYTITLTARDQTTGFERSAHTVNVSITENRQISFALYAWVAAAGAIVLGWIVGWFLRAPEPRKTYALGRGKYSSPTLTVGADRRALLTSHDISFPLTYDFFQHFAVLQQSALAQDVEIEEMNSGRIRIKTDRPCLSKPIVCSAWGGAASPKPLETLTVDLGDIIEVESFPCRVTRDDSGAISLTPAWQVVSDEKGIDMLRVTRKGQEMIAEQTQEPLTLLSGDVIGFGKWLYEVNVDTHGDFSLRRLVNVPRKTVAIGLGMSALLAIIPGVYLLYCYFWYGN